ncbi:MAG: DUF6745 domain-containing protein, partial [Alsobacter sp.]
YSQLGSQLGSQLDRQLDSQLDSQLYSQLDSQLRSQLYSQLDSQLRSQLYENWNARWLWSPSDLCWLAYYRWAVRIGMKISPELEHCLSIMERLVSSCFMAFSWNGCTIFVQHPSVATFDDRQRLHNTTGPALAWSDGYPVYAISGVRLDLDRGAKAVANQLTAKEISEERNAEVRRVLVERYCAGDIGRYFRDIGARVIHEDLDRAGLERRLYIIEQPDDEPIIAIEVTNHSMEPDASRKKYWFRCAAGLTPLAINGVRRGAGSPQEMTCHNAIASTYGMRGEDYHPEAES